MKMNIRKKVLMLVNVFTLILGISFAKASDFAILTNDYSTYVASAHAAPEQDRLINTVKVFYNPVADQVNISFRLAKQNSVTIKVMDALGNEVLQLLNTSLESGNQNLSFDASGKLTAGFYFVRVISGSETVVKRISIR